MNPATLMWGVIFGSIGVGFIVYGKKQGVFVPLLCGIGLIVCPYVISKAVLLVLVCVVLVALPFLIKR
jgi:hypothetical protein